MSSMADLYQEVIMDHSRERHGFGLVPVADAESFQLNPTCGDEIRLQVNLGSGADGAAMIAGIHWEGRGCSISQASASVLVDLATGATVDRAGELADLFRDLMHARHEPLPDDRLDQLEDGAAFAGVARYPARVKCAMLGWVALLDALAQTGQPRTIETNRITR